MRSTWLRPVNVRDCLSTVGVSDECREVDICICRLKAELMPQMLFTETQSIKFGLSTQKHYHDEQSLSVFQGYSSLMFAV